MPLLNIAINTNLIYTHKGEEAVRLPHPYALWFSGLPQGYDFDFYKSLFWEFLYCHC